MRKLGPLIAGLAVTAALAVAHPGIARAAGVYNEWQTEDGLCMGVMGGNMAPGTAIITWACDGTSNQFWEFDTFTGTPGTFLLRNEANPSECLSVFQKATYAGAPLVIWPCKDSSDNQDQLWSRWDFPSDPLDNFNSGLQIMPSGPQGSAIVQSDILPEYFWSDTDFVFT